MTTATALRPSVKPRQNSAVQPFAIVVAVFAWILLFAGGLVTSTGSSLAVPDWPLSFGQAMPPMIGGVRFEHGHRVIAGVVALLTWTLTGWVAAVEPRLWVRRLAYAASGLILLQAILGGITVLMRLPPAVSIAHACLGQAVFCLIVAVVESMRPASKTAAGALWKAGAFAFAALYLQLVFGALLRHTGQGLMLHMGWAAVAACAAWVASTRGILHKELGGPSMLLSGLIVAQLALGYLSWRYRFSPDFTTTFGRSSLVITAHLAVGALLLATTTVFTMRAYRAR